MTDKAETTFHITQSSIDRFPLNKGLSAIDRAMEQMNAMIEAYLRACGADPKRHQLAIKNEKDGRISYTVEERTYREPWDKPAPDDERRKALLESFERHWNGCIDVSTAWALVCRDIQGGGSLAQSTHDQMERALSIMRLTFAPDILGFLDGLRSALQVPIAPEGETCDGETLSDIADMVRGDCPMAKWMTSVDVKNLADFEWWLGKQAEQMLTMQRGFMDDPEDDELFTHCAAKGGAFLSALYTFRRARKLDTPPATTEALTRKALEKVVNNVRVLAMAYALMVKAHDTENDGSVIDGADEALTILYRALSN